MNNTIIIQLDKIQATKQLLVKITLMQDKQNEFTHMSNQQQDKSKKYNDDGFLLRHNGTIDIRSRQLTQEELKYFRTYGKVPLRVVVKDDDAKPTANSIALRSIDNPHGHCKTYLKAKAASKHTKATRGLPKNWWDTNINPIVGFRLPQNSVTSAVVVESTIGTGAKLNGSNLY